MIEHFDERPHGAGDLAVVDEEAGMLVYFTADRDIEAERVSVQSPTLVSVRHVWEAMR